MSILSHSYFQFYRANYYYFVHQFFRGEPERKKNEGAPRCTTANCCLHDPKISEQSPFSTNDEAIKDKRNPISDGQDGVMKTSMIWNAIKPTTIISVVFKKLSLFQKLCKEYVNQMIDMLLYFCNNLCGIIVHSFIIMTYMIGWTIHGDEQKKIKTYGITSQLNLAKEKCVELLHEKVREEPQHNRQNQSTEVVLKKTSQCEQSTVEAGEFYSTKQIFSQSLIRPTSEDSFKANSAELLSSLSSTQSPPSSFHRSQFSPPFARVLTTVSKDDGKVPPKGGVAVLPFDITVEAHARIKEREQKLSEQKYELFQNNKMETDWTVTSRKSIWKMPTSKTNNCSETGSKIIGDQSNAMLKPVGTNVSRVSRPSDPEEAQFIFRLPTPQNIFSNGSTNSNLLMGPSVFSPVREAEEMRNEVNRRLSETPSELCLSLRSNTSLDDLHATSCTNTAYDALNSDVLNLVSTYPTSRSCSQSRLHTFLPPTDAAHNHSLTENVRNTSTSMLRQRSRTVEPRILQRSINVLTR
ncbi:unnamed protein product [Thelazia callipaeda]|uniref:Protein kinase domain-containing protein n=1 Tax=Thelazia callipaeda TaxID=103827 RepID=A0A0N5CRV2_THECL|nr:unnamed protein product [Thelazia callipaeda]